MRVGSTAPIDVRSYVDRFPSFVREIVTSSPPGGEGVNNWTFRAARAMHRCSIELPPEVMEEILETYAGRPLKPGEARRAIRSSDPDNPRNHTIPSAPRWPQRNLVEVERVAQRYPGIAGLHEASRLKGESVDAEEAIDLLFPGNPLLCIALKLDWCETLPREEWRGVLGGHQFLVPSPMLARQGQSQDGRLSARTLANTGPRQYLVVEFDFREKDSEGVDTPAGPMLRRLGEKGITIADLCASLHLHLCQYWPLGMVVHSGGKSLHGWYPCGGRTEDELRAFMRLAVSLGADAATWTRCQLVRLPGGLRRPGEIRQRIEYLNPTHLLSIRNV